MVLPKGGHTPGIPLLSGLSQAIAEAAIGSIASGYDVAVAEGFVGTRAEWLASLEGDPGPTGPGVPDGGATGQVLAKTGAGDQETAWVDPAADVVTSVNTQTGDVVLDADDIDDTSTSHKFVNSTEKSQIGTAYSHTSATNNPHSVTAAQAGTYTSGEIDNALALKLDASAVPTELTDLDTTVTGAQLDSLKSKVDGIASGATANDTDANLKNRANHTGTQAISTVNGLQSALDGKAAADHQHGVDGVATSMAIGPGATTGTNTGATAVGQGASVTGPSCTAIGRGASAAAGSAVAIGAFTWSGGVGSFSLGTGAYASADRAMAIGANAESHVSDTAVVKANDLDVQRSNGTGATRVALRSPDGTKYWLSVDNAGVLTVTAA